jgi:hypothetical protein
MANNPPARNVLRHNGAGNPQVFPNLPTLINGSQDGADLGTGGPALAAMEVPPTGNFSCNRIVEFKNTRFAVIYSTTAANAQGVYEKDTGGADLWGRVTGDGGTLVSHGAGTGLHVLHPLGVPTLALLYQDAAGDINLRDTVDGTTGANWAGVTEGLQLENNISAPFSWGESIVYRNSIVWVHDRFAGSAGTGDVTQYDLVTGLLTRYDVSGHNNPHGSQKSPFVHKNKLFLLCPVAAANRPLNLFRLDGGSFVSIWDGGSSDVANTEENHPCMFTDPATGDLVLVTQTKVPSLPDARIRHLSAADVGASPTITDVSATTLGAVNVGAGKYRAGGTNDDNARRWSVFNDTETDPANPRIFLTTWINGVGTSETWEWKGLAAPIEAVASLAGVNSEYARPHAPISGGIRSPRVAAIEIGDASNSVTEVLGGTKIFFRGQGISTVGVVTFYGADDEGTPVTVVPIAAASLVVESGSPATTPVISGNTLTNFTSDNGATLYSVVLDVGAAGVDVGAGDVGILIPNLVV